jgi:hypothetical protein
VQGTSWADGLELVGDDQRLVAHAGLLPLRLLAERTGLTGKLTAAVARRGFEPVYDRGQLLLDLALVLIDGGEAISDFQTLKHLRPIIGAVPSTPTVWRALAETGELQLRRINTAVTEFRRHWWTLLDARPEGFPWLSVAGRELTGVTVVDLDASIVFAASDKDNAMPTYKGGIGFCPTWPPATTPTTCWSSTRGPETPPPTAPPTTSPYSTAPSSGCPDRSATGYWFAWTAPGSPTNCSTTSRPAAASGAGGGNSRSAGPAPTPRWTQSPRFRDRRGSQGSTRTPNSCPTRASPS